MIRTLIRIYKETKNKTYLSAAVKKNWITKEEMNMILNGDK
ncbi:hypothetical protein [Clostridium sp. AM58-1XD]|nr:hypothetical protein [Clostridium sp. AM58-1XD]